MLNIFDVPPLIPGTPRPGLKIASENLLEAARTGVQRRKQKGNDFRNRYIAKVLPNAQRMSVELFELKVIDFITRQYGFDKGPVRNAKPHIGEFAMRASSAGYPLEDKDVQEKFAYFVLSYATEGMEGEDTTGTQMGNFRGEWRGGGFG